MTDRDVQHSPHTPGPYAELHAHTAMSFLDGVSEPEALVTQAAQLGLSALAITDHDGLYGVVQFAQAARRYPIDTVFGAELTLGTSANRADKPTGIPDPSGEHLVVLARDPQGYRSLSAAISQANLRQNGQGPAQYDLVELAAHADGHWQILTGCRKGAVRRALEPSYGSFDPLAAQREVEQLAEIFGRDNVAIEITHHADIWDDERCQLLVDIAHRSKMRVVATGNVHYARPAQAELSHVVAAIRSRRSLDHMDGWLPAHGQSYIASPAQMYRRHANHPQAVRTAAQIARECAFDLSLVAPRLPPYDVPAGHTEATWLTELVYRNAPRYYGSRNSETVAGAWAQIDHELQVITQLDFPGYFLIVYQIMQMCRDRGILAQGRGSAANSAVCYVLGITAVDPIRHSLLFERFLSPGRQGAPDIDIDIESGRREEVIQDIYRRYDRTHAAQVANVISYRPKSAIRDAARALGYDAGQYDAWSKYAERGGALPTTDSTDAAANNLPQDVAAVAEQLLRLPRHLGIHPGGMVLCDRPIIEVCPVQWATKPGRTVVQWDKEDCADAGLVKFDLLGLGMLTALRLMFEHIERCDGKVVTLHEIPQDDPAVYDLLSRADTVGVFQVESRAQMATLPRLQPRTFYDIVVEVALIRPGPIQGGSVHPYIQRRHAQRLGKLPPDEQLYPHPLLKPALERTLGVPLFQEQLMQIAIDAAGFSAAEADQLRRAIGAKRSHERIQALEQRLRQGMSQRGIARPIQDEIIAQLHAFADFGFPESHSFSFAYLVYASAWVKVHYPAAFYAGLLAAQPMGFYSPQSLTADARRHGVRVLRPCVQYSDVLASVEITDQKDACVRLGLTQIKGISTAVAERIVKQRMEHGLYADMADCVRRAHLTRKHVENLAAADAFAAIQPQRRHAMWQAGPASLNDEQTLALDHAESVLLPTLPPSTPLDDAATDVAMTGISPQSFPTQFLRDDLRAGGISTIADVLRAQPGKRIAVAGVVTHRQRPATAKGVVFLSLEDETGLLNVICAQGVWKRFRPVLRTSPALILHGRVERADVVVNLIAEYARSLTLVIPSRSRDFQ